MYTRPDTRAKRVRRHKRIRFKVSGSTERPRLAVFRSLNHIYAQVIDDSRGTTLVAASTHDADGKADGAKQADAKSVGVLVAKRAKDKGITRVVFDRGGFLYHGRIKALAEGAREGGLDF